MTHDRRTFLARAGVLGSSLAVAGLAGCLDDVSDFDPAGDDATTTTDPMALGSGLAIGSVFTGFGGRAFDRDVDPDEPNGGRLVTVETVAPGEQATLSWRETVERTVTPTETTAVGVGTTTVTPKTEIVERSGRITASGLDEAHATFLPMFWQPGETTTHTSGIWLSREAYRELSETRRTAWSPDVLTRITWVGEAVQERIHGAVEDVDEDEIYLEAEGELVGVDLTVDGQPRTVQAIEAHDTFGNEYLVLAEEANPLVVTFTYNAVSTGVTGFDTGIWTVIKAVFSGYRIVSLDPP